MRDNAHNCGQKWAGLRHSIPDFLKGGSTSPPLTSPSFLIHNNVCDVKKKKSKDYYSLLDTEKAQPPSINHKWKSDFNLSDDHLREFFLLSHSVALESYVKAFQYKVLNNILYTNKKLSKIGYRTDDVCTFCEAEPETLYHILYQCPYSRQFWNDFESYWYLLSNKGFVFLCRMLFGIIYEQCPSTELLNYFIIVGKLFLWDCRRNQIHPKVKVYQNK